MKYNEEDLKCKIGNNIDKLLKLKEIRLIKLHDEIRQLELECEELRHINVFIATGKKE